MTNEFAGVGFCFNFVHKSLMYCDVIEFQWLHTTSILSITHAKISDFFFLPCCNCNLKDKIQLKFLFGILNMSFVTRQVFRSCQIYCPIFSNVVLRLSAARPGANTQFPNIKLLHLSSLQYKKNTKGKSFGKQKESSALDKFLDELSDDEDEVKGSEESEKRQVRINHESPVNKFLTSKSKGSKSKAMGVTYADVCEVTDIDQVWQDMDSITHELQQHFIHHVSLR